MEGRNEYQKGLWTEEDRILMDYIRVHGKGKWNRIMKMSGLKRGGKSCRLRWINYPSTTVKRGGFSEEEEDLILRLHNLLGNSEKSVQKSNHGVAEETVVTSVDDDGYWVGQRL